MAQLHTMIPCFRRYIDGKMQESVPCILTLEHSRHSDPFGGSMHGQCMDANEGTTVCPAFKSGTGEVKP